MKKLTILALLLLNTTTLFAHGTDDPYFVGSTVLSNSFPTKEMEYQKLQTKLSPFYFDIDVSEPHPGNPGKVHGKGFFVSAVYTQYETEIGHFGFGGGLSYFHGSGRSVLLVAGSPLENFTGPHEIDGLIGSFSAMMDLTKKIDWLDLPMFVGLSYQSLKTEASGIFNVLNKDGAISTNPFGAVEVNQESKISSFGLYTGIGSKFRVNREWLTLMPFTMISVPFKKPETTTRLSDERFRERVPTSDIQSFIPAVGVEVGVPKTNTTFLYLPKFLTQGVSMYSLSYTHDF